MTDHKGPGDPLGEFEDYLSHTEVTARRESSYASAEFRKLDECDALSDEIQAQEEMDDSITVPDLSAFSEALENETTVNATGEKITNTGDSRGPESQIWSRIVSVLVAGIITIFFVLGLVVVVAMLICDPKNIDTEKEKVETAKFGITPVSKALSTEEKASDSQKGSTLLQPGTSVSVDVDLDGEPQGDPVDTLEDIENEEENSQTASGLSPAG